MDELGTELDGMWDARVPNGVNSAPDAVAGLENAGANPALLERAQGGQSGGAGADDGDVGGKGSQGSKVLRVLGF